MSTVWKDITGLIKSAHSGMSSGQVIHSSTFNGDKSMSAWVMCHPKLDYDAVAQPLTTSALLALSPSLMICDPDLHTVNQILDYFMSQLQAMHSGSPIAGVFGCSLYTHLHSSITNAPLRAAVRAILRLAHSQYDFILQVAEPAGELFEVSSEAQLAEINWLQDVPHHQLIEELQAQIAAVQQTQDVLSTYLSQTEIRQAQSIEAFSSSNTRTILQDMPFQASLSQYETSLEQYIVIHALNARLRFIQSLYCTYLGLAIDYDALDGYNDLVPLTNTPIKRLIDTTSATVNVIFIYYRHIYPPCPQTDVLGTLTRNSVLSAPGSTFSQLRDSACSRYNSLHTKPFLSRASPEPSRIQIAAGFDPFVNYYGAIENVPLAAHPQIFDDIAPASAKTSLITHSTSTFEPATSSNVPSRMLPLSKILPSPCCGLFPQVMLSSITLHDMSRPWEYPSPQTAYFTLATTHVKLLSILSGLLTILPTAQHSRVPIFRPGAASASWTTQTNQGPIVPAYPSTKAYPSLLPLLQSGLLPPPPAPYMAYQSLPEQILHVLQTCNNLQLSVYLSACISTLIGNEFDICGVGRIDACSETLLRAKQPAFTGRIELPTPQHGLATWDINFASSAKQALQDVIDGVTTGCVEEQKSTAESANSPSSLQAARSALAMINASIPKAVATASSTSSTKKTPPTKKRPAAQPKAAKVISYYLGHNTDTLTLGQLFNVNFTVSLHQLFQSSFAPSAGKRRALMRVMNDIHSQHISSQELDADELAPQFYREKLLPRSAPPTNSTALRSSGPTPYISYPAYSMYTLFVLERLFEYYITALQLQLVTRNEYFIFLYIFHWLYDHYQSIGTLSRGVGPLPGSFGTGSLPLRQNLQFTSYDPNFTLVPQASPNSSSVDFYNIVPITTATQTMLQSLPPQLALPNADPTTTISCVDAQQLLLQPFTNTFTVYIPQLLTLSSSRPNYNPAPILVNSVQLKPPTSKAGISAIQLQQFQDSFPQNDTISAQYPTYSFNFEAGIWEMPLESIPDCYKPSCGKKTTAPNSHAASSSSTKPTAKNAQKGKKSAAPTQPVKIVESPSPPAIQVFPHLVHPPVAPTSALFRCYGLLLDCHFNLLLVASMLSITFPRHLLLKTLQFAPQSAPSNDSTHSDSPFSLASATDLDLLRHYFTNRHSITFRTYYPTAQHADDFFTCINQIAQTGVKAVLSQISATTKTLRTKISQLRAIYPSAGVRDIDIGKVLVQDHQYLSTYSDIPCHLDKLPLKTATQTIPILSYNDITAAQIFHIEDNLNSSIIPILMFLVKANSKGLRGGKIDIQLPNNNQPNFMSFLPSLHVISEGSEP